MIEVPAHEKDHVRVFAVNGEWDVGNLRQTFLSRLDPDAPVPAHEVLAQLLGTAEFDPAYVEIFPVADVAELGVSRYLSDALDVKESALSKDRGKLDALAGSVMIVLSAAFPGKALSFTPGAALTLIGTYPTEAAVEPSAIALPNPGGEAIPSPEDSETRQSRALGSGLIALIIGVGLLIAIGLVLAISGGEPQ